VEIEILTPPSLLKSESSSSTPTIEIEGVNVLEPALPLGPKCRSVLECSSDWKKRTGSSDIKFLLSWHTTNEGFQSPADVPVASKRFGSALYSKLLRGTLGGRKP
jgi:hypothetical protein